MSVSIVVQRFRECKLLLDEKDYVTVGESASEGCCGLLAYVSFAAAATRESADQAAQTLLNLPVCTTGLWGDRSCGESSSTVSLLALAEDPACVASSLVIVPQANLISKVKQQGKSIQYHGQIAKEKGQGLYDFFCDCIRGKLLEAQCSSRKEELPQWYRDRRAWLEKQQQSQTTVSPSTPPNELFRDESKYSEWDEEGILPTKDAQGQPLSKGQTKKLKKFYETHSKKHDKWKAAGGSKTDPVTPPPPPAAHWEDALDPSFCRFVAGTFGKRQGLELRSDMGPFVHSFVV